MAHGDRLANLPDCTAGALARHSPADALAPLGESLLEATTLLLWADAHQGGLSAARERYDEANRVRP